MIRGMQIRVLIGQKVREFRQQRGMTQRELAERLGRQEVTISSIERGRNFPSEDTLSALVEHLGVPLNAFFEVGDLSSQDTERETAIARILAVVRTLPRRDLDIALRQLEAFVASKPA